MLAVSRSIEDKGGTPIWAVPPAYTQAQPVHDCGYEVHGAPLIRGVNKPHAHRIDSFADILLNLGFSEPLCFEVLVRDWMRLIEKIRPDRVILDYAPAAQLAALFLGVESFQITNGFDAPPPECPIFGYSARGPYIEKKNSQKIGQLESTLAALKGLSHNQESPGIADYFAYPFKIYDCLPEADPYSPRTYGIYVGPLSVRNKEHDEQPIPWSEYETSSDRIKIFAYLRGISDARELLDAIGACKADAVCVWPDIPAEFLGRPHPYVYVQREPINMHEALRIAHAVINYGSTTTVNQTLLMGKPQLMIPNDLEKIITSQTVEKNGAGITHQRRASYQDEISRLIHAKQERNAALKISQKYSGDCFSKNKTYFLARLIS
ncbi:glycosyltransferase [Sphingomonas sp. NCPPB 2930]